MMLPLVVLYFRDDGEQTSLQDSPHKLRCESPKACTFSDCSCGPAKPVLDGKLRPSYEEQVRQAQQKASKR